MGADIDNDARMWLARALGDLEAARRRPGRPQRPHIVAFHAQQAAEKALKGALVLAGVAVPRTHDLTPVTPAQAATAVRQGMVVVRTVRDDFERLGVSTLRLEPQYARPASEAPRGSAGG